MRFGFSRAHGALRQLIRQKSDLYDLTRDTGDGKGRFGESDANTTTVTDVSLYLHAPNEVNIDGIGGERIDGDLAALALPSADVEVDDRLTHGSETYEVEDIIDQPNENDPQYRLCSLTRVTN